MSSIFAPFTKEVEASIRLPDGHFFSDIIFFSMFYNLVTKVMEIVLKSIYSVIYRRVALAVVFFSKKLPVLVQVVVVQIILAQGFPATGVIR